MSRKWTPSKDWHTHNFFWRKESRKIRYNLFANFKPSNFWNIKQILCLELQLKKISLKARLTLSYQKLKGSWLNQEWSKTDSMRLTIFIKELKVCNMIKSQRNINWAISKFQRCSLKTFLQMSKILWMKRLKTSVTQ